MIFEEDHVEMGAFQRGSAGKRNIIGFQRNSVPLAGGYRGTESPYSYIINFVDVLPC